VLLYRLDLLRRSPPAVAALRALQGRIAVDDMQRLNARVKLERVSERAVASDFLATTRESKGKRPGGGAGESAVTSSNIWPWFLASLSAAIVVAIPLGIAAARRRRLGAAILAVAGVVQTIPTLALLVFMIPLLGIGTAPAVAALFLYAFSRSSGTRSPA